MRPSMRSNAAARALEQAGEGREVERELLDAALAQQLDRADDEELREAVRRVAVAAHEESDTAARP